jgi:Tol biopolymer transport system component
MKQYNINHMKRIYAVLLLLLTLAACESPSPTPKLLVSLVADGRERTFEYLAPVTVSEFLADAEIELGQLDRVTPERFTQITDGMRVTVVRVAERTECEQVTIPNTRQTVFNEALKPGEELLAQVGQNGVEEVCYVVTIEDGEVRNRVETSRVEITAPQDEIVYIGPTGQLDPVPITGTLAYVNNNNAWVMRGSSTAKRLLTTSSDLDMRVFTLSPDGSQLLFTRDAEVDRETFLNQLWLIRDTSVDAEPIQLVPEDVLRAEWIPGQPSTISYSTGEAQQTAPGWRAFNDLWRMRIDPQSGEALSIEEILEPSQGGLYGWWGTVYRWSPDGSALAWAQADSIGLVDLETSEFTPLLQFPVFETRADWSWRANISWSPDAVMLLTTIHGAPVGNEAPQFSPAFNVAITDTDGTFQAEIVKNAGIWAAPQYSPLITRPGTEFPTGYMAYLQARDITNSINSQAEYDLVVADRDGSNARKLFPESGQPGLSAPQDLAWSPDGQQIAFIYQGNLWVVDVVSGVANQLTLDSGASKPVWTQ